MSEHVRTVGVVRYETAASLVASAMRHAAEKDWSIAVAVVDPWGALVASGRMDGVAAPTLEFATDKAYTATLGKPTSAFAERMASTPGLTLGQNNRPRLCAWDGGIPLRFRGELIGAIGVSGAAGPEDVECAEAAVADLQLEP